MIGTMPKVMARCDTSSQPRVWALIEAFAPADRSVFAGLWLAATDSFFAFWPSAHWGFVCPSSLPSQQAIDRPLARSERCRTRAVLETRTAVLVFRTHAANRCERNFADLKRNSRQGLTGQGRSVGAERRGAASLTHQARPTSNHAVHLCPHTCTGT